MVEDEQGDVREERAAKNRNACGLQRCRKTDCRGRPVASCTSSYTGENSWKFPGIFTKISTKLRQENSLKSHYGSFQIAEISKESQRGPLRLFDLWASRENCPEPLKPMTAVPPYHHGEVVPQGEKINWDNFHPEIPVENITFYFSAQELKNMKKEAGVKCSSHDALNAHFWRCVNRARDLQNSNENQDFYIVVNIRDRVQPKISHDLFGCEFFAPGVHYTGIELGENSLKTTSEKIRECVSFFEEEKMPEFLRNLSKTNLLRFLFSAPSSQWYVNTAWTHLQLWDVDFGSGCSRNIQPVIPSSGLVCTMEAGEVAENSNWYDNGAIVNICLDKISMDKLVADTEIRKYK